MSTENDIKKYLAELEDGNIEVRNTARWQLTGMGGDAVPALVAQLKSDSERQRWEAASILGEIRDERAMNDLVEALLDDSISVHWVATEALIKYGRDVIAPLLEGLTRHFDSMRFRQGAYHILHMLERFHQLDPNVHAVLEALRDIEPSVSAPWAAERAIEHLKFGKN